MHSGRAVDSDGKVVPRKIINSFTAKFNGNTVFEVNMRPSVSSNPSWYFHSRLLKLEHLISFGLKMVAKNIPRPKNQNCLNAHKG